MIARWFTGVRVFLMWLLGFALALVILALLHELLMVFIVNTLQWDRYVVRFMNLLYYIPAGGACIAYFIFAYAYLERSAKKGLLSINSMRLLGYQLLLISLIQLGLIGYRFLPASGLNFLLVFGEALAAVILLAFSYMKRPRTTLETARKPKP
jgi:hypothetical protein